jgi:uncharacterized SAM-binding protein YcdF (DUF218 family)
MSLTAILLPGSLPFLLLGLTAAALLLRAGQRAAVFGRRLLVLLLAAYTLFSLPLTAGCVASLMARGYEPYRGADRAALKAVVVLDAGTTRYRTAEGEFATLNAPAAFRVLEAQRVAALLDDPVFVLTGGSYQPARGASELIVMRDYLIARGVPAGRIIVDQTSRNTREHAINVPRLLRARGIDRFVVVTSATHIRRAMLAFEAEGARPVASPAAVMNPVFPKWLAIVPQPASLQVSEDGGRDLLALAYYWSRGWLARNGSTR